MFYRILGKDQKKLNFVTFRKLNIKLQLAFSSSVHVIDLNAIRRKLNMHELHSA